MPLIYTSNKKQFVIPSKKTPDLLKSIEQFFIEYFPDRSAPAGFILMEKDNSFSFMPSPYGLPAPHDLDADYLVGASIDVIVPKYFFDSKKAYKTIDEFAPPFAYLTVNDDTTIITTNEGIGWTINTFRLEDLFHKYVPFRQN